MATAMLDLPARGTPLSKTMRPRAGSVTIDRGPMEARRGWLFHALNAILDLANFAPRSGGRRRPDPSPRQPVLQSATARPYIGLVRTRPDYGDKRARNKRTGPGCNSRRLHQ